MSTEEAQPATKPTTEGQQPSNTSPTSLYVGDLPPSVDEQVLIEAFTKIGPVYHARVCRDITTKYSLGYGYINFYDPKHAEEAINSMNYELIHNRPIRIMWSQRDPSLRKSGKGNIYIKNLAKSITQRQLYDTFECFGSILSCKIALDESGQSKGFGYIHFDKEESAQNAIHKINGMSIMGQLVYVGPFIPRNVRQSGASKPRFNNVYVKSFPPETTDDSLREMFAEFGEIISCCVSVDDEGKSKGFGFVCFKEPEQAEAAVEAMHGKEISGRQLYVNRAQKKEERQEELKQKLDKQKADRQSKYVRGVNLYVKNLDDSIDDAALEDAFSRYGSITSAKVMRDSQGRSKGFGFVCFTQADEATRAVCEMNNFLLGSKPLYVALAQRKDERRQQMLQEITRSTQTRFGVTPIIPTPNAGFFPQAPFQRAAQYFPQGMIPNQPRWNRPAGIPGSMPPGVNVARPGANHYFPAGAGGLPANLSNLTMRQPIARRLMPGSVPSGQPMVSNVMQGQPRRPGPGISQITANGIPPNIGSMQAVCNAQPRHVAGQSMPSRQAQVPFPPSVPYGCLRFGPALTPLGDQLANRPALAQQAQQPPQQVPNRKDEFGERLYSLVQELDPSRTSKITGMLLGLDDAEILNLMQSKEALKAKIEEAVSVLDNAANASAEQPSQNRGDVNGAVASVATGGKETS